MSLAVTTAHGTVVPFGFGDGSSVGTAAGLIPPVDESTAVIRQPGRTYDKQFRFKIRDLMAVNIKINLVW
jgi:hypothetical protein